MRCGCKKRDRATDFVTYCIRLWRKELLYDISNYAYVEADISPIDSENSRHQLFDVIEYGNIDRVTRVLNLVYRECVEMLYPYCKRAIPVTEEVHSIDDKLVEDECYIVDLVLPRDFSETTVELLRDLLHEYLVYRALADWLSMVRAGSEGNWLAKAENIREKIRSALMSRRSLVRRPLKPF